MDIEHLTFSEGPKKVAPFSHAVRAGEFLFITGQMLRKTITPKLFKEA